ncbi:MAG: hypothetical protein GX362_01160 [Methanosarcinaceae archaeon]|nr:hypothetical protein [Methanosarcinaceae archaeon]
MKNKKNKEKKEKIKTEIKQKNKTKNKNKKIKQEIKQKIKMIFLKKKNIFSLYIKLSLKNNRYIKVKINEL